MKIAVMQPYFFPYLGYFQLVAAVDRFIAWDDVQYINRGWVNRNRILLNGEPAYITLPLDKAAQTAHINERRIADKKGTATKILGQLHAAYRKAPYYAETRQLVEDIFAHEGQSLSCFLFDSLQKICLQLGIETPLVLSSSLQKNDEGLSGSARIIAICKALQADTYVNAIGGRELYCGEEFRTSNIDLRFIEMSPIAYQQNIEKFVPYLSIIDVMMFNEKDVIKQYLQQYTLSV
jgi:hypothetical protein